MKSKYILHYFPFFIVQVDLLYDKVKLDCIKVVFDLDPKSCLGSIRQRMKINAFWLKLLFYSSFYQYVLSEFKLV